MPRPPRSTLFPYTTLFRSISKPSNVASRTACSVNQASSTDINPSLKSIGIVGARGHTGSELIRLIAAHPSLDLTRSEEHTSELQSRRDLVCRLLLEKKKKQ